MLCKGAKLKPGDRGLAREKRLPRSELQPFAHAKGLLLSTLSLHAVQGNAFAQVYGIPCRLI
jgi:hypothetical protein